MTIVVHAFISKYTIKYVKENLVELERRL